MFRQKWSKIYSNKKFSTHAKKVGIPINYRRRPICSKLNRNKWKDKILTKFEIWLKWYVWQVIRVEVGDTKCPDWNSKQHKL